MGDKGRRVLTQDSTYNTGLQCLFAYRFYSLATSHFMELNQHNEPETSLSPISLYSCYWLKSKTSQWCKSMFSGIFSFNLSKSLNLSLFYYTCSWSLVKRSSHFLKMLYHSSNILINVMQHFMTTFPSSLPPKGLLTLLYGLMPVVSINVKSVHGLVCCPHTTYFTMCVREKEGETER